MENDPIQSPGVRRVGCCRAPVKGRGVRTWCRSAGGQTGAAWRHGRPAARQPPAAAALSRPASSSTAAVWIASLRLQLLPLPLPAGEEGLLGITVHSLLLAYAQHLIERSTKLQRKARSQGSQMFYFTTHKPHALESLKERRDRAATWACWAALIWPCKAMAWALRRPSMSPAAFTPLMVSLRDATICARPLRSFASEACRTAAPHRMFQAHDAGLGRGLQDLTAGHNRHCLPYAQHCKRDSSLAHCKRSAMTETSVRGTSDMLYAIRRTQELTVMASSSSCREACIV